MWGDYGYVEEGFQGKVHNFRLLRRLYPFFLPLKKSFLIILLVTVSATLLNLVLPYISKLAVDNYIIPSYYRIAPDKADPETKNRLQNTLNPRAGSDKPGSAWFVGGSVLKKLPHGDRAEYEASGIISSDTYYRIIETAEKKKLLEARPELFERTNDGLFIKHTDLFQLPAESIRKLRAEDMNGLFKLGLSFLLILAVMFTLNYGEYYLLEYVGQNLMQSIRLRLFNHLIGQGMKFFDRFAVGRLVTRVTNDVQNLNEMCKSLMQAVFSDLFVLLGIIAVLLNLNWRLALVCFIMIPVMMVLAVLFSRMARGVFRELSARIATLNGFLQESFTGMKVVQAFCREAVRMNRFDDINRNTYKAGMKQVGVFAVFMPAVDACGSIAVALLIWYGGMNILSQDMTIGSLAAFLGYLSMFFRPIRDLAERYNTMQSAMASTERIFGFFDIREEVPDTGVKSITLGQYRDCRIPEHYIRV